MGTRKKSPCSTPGQTDSLWSLATQSLLTSLSSIEVVLTRTSGNQLAVFSDLYSFGVRFVCFHTQFLLRSNLHSVQSVATIAHLEYAVKGSRPCYLRASHQAYAFYFHHFLICLLSPLARLFWSDLICIQLSLPCAQ